MGQLVLIQAPQQQVVSLDEAKAQLHVDTASDDARVSALILAATQRFDGARGILGRALMQQTWQIQLNDWPAAFIDIPLPPLIGVTSIAYLDGSGVEQTLDPSLYRVVNGGENRASRILRAVGGATWPSVAVDQPDAVRVTFDAGYVDHQSPSNNAVPEPIRQAIILLADEWYNRGATNDLPQAVQSLTTPFKVARLGGNQYQIEDEVMTVAAAAGDPFEAFFRG
jgi:uncharacterized phiE125 gp8 family phage protein